MIGGPPKPEPQVVHVSRKPTAARMTAAMKATGLPMHTVWRVYGAMLEVLDQDGPAADGDPSVAPPRPDICEVARMTPEQCRQARALVDWSTRDLARASGIMARTIGLWERGKHPSVEPMMSLLRTAFEEAGIVFGPDGGSVRLGNAAERGSAP
ncbi:helix-turn-helix domain-containing protein [Azospirillum canadense]|uniref:helix-turn-helix domain-containing protein n=1 Tax=Azospirillum canadense TaxID=403962 RepID=UPI002226179D|nr:helix-turn-helix transcriptional regulator [Azospirillum canadense]MCW2241500.1 DNA-binding XRE family transcriptional regulator [Azospirillum canadense]